MDKEYTSGKMEEDTKEALNRTKCTEKERILAQMVENMKVHTKTKKKKDMVLSGIQMEKFMKECG